MCLYLILALSANAQFPILPGILDTPVSAASPLTIRSHSFFYASPQISCSYSGPTSPYTITCTTSSVTITNAGDKIGVLVGFAMDIGLSQACSGATGMSTALTDGSSGANTYTLRAGPSAIHAAGYCMYGYTTRNVVTATGPLTLVFGGPSTDTGSYPILSVFELYGGNSMSENDASLATASGGGPTTTPSMTSTGNVSGAGEIAFAIIAYGINTGCGPGFSTLDAQSPSPTAVVCYATNPTAGSSLTFSPTQSNSTLWNSTMIGLK